MAKEKNPSNPETRSKPARKTAQKKAVALKAKSVSSDIYKSQKKFFEAAYKTGQDVWTHADDLTFLNDFMSVLTEHLPQDSKLLDLGCGRGMNSLRMAKRGFRVWAVDIVPHVLTVARKEAKGAGVQSRIQFKTQDFLTLRAPRNFFDGVLDRGCFHHIRQEDWLQYLKNLTAFLKPRALFLLVTFSDKSPSFDRSKGHGQIHKGSIGISHPHYDHFFSPAVLKKIFSSHFQILKIRHRQDKPYSFYYTLMRAK